MRIPAQTVIFLLESVVFSLIGLQLPALIRALSHAETGLARLDELADSDAAPDAVIDRVRASLQARIGHTRPRIEEDGASSMTSSQLVARLVSALARKADAATVTDIAARPS